MKALFMATMRAITASVPLFPGWGSLHFHQNLQKAHGVLTWCLSSCDGPTSANPLRWSLHLVRAPLVPPIIKKNYCLTSLIQNFAVLPFTFPQTLRNHSSCPPWWTLGRPPATAPWVPPQSATTCRQRKASPSSLQWAFLALTVSGHWKPRSVCGLLPPWLHDV